VITKKDSLQQIIYRGQTSHSEDLFCNFLLVNGDYFRLGVV
jgi:hypothetical protein